MQLSTPIADARTLLQTDSNGLTDTDAISLATEALLSIISALILKGVNAAKVYEAFLTATDQVGIYNWPDGVAATWTLVGGGTAPELWLLKTINVNYTDTQQQNYVEPKIIDTGNLPDGVSYQNMRATQSSENPVIENRGASFEVFPAPNHSTGGANLTNFFYILYFAPPTAYATTSDTVAYPLNLNSRVLSARMAFIQAMRGEEDAQARSQSYEKLYDAEFDKLLNILRKGSQKTIQPTGISWTGYEF